MPYISITTNQSLSGESKKNLKAEAGRLISLLPNKSESVLMVAINDGQYMTFRGEEAPCAYVSLHLYTESPMDAKKTFTEAFTKSVESIAGVATKDVFVNIHEYDHWGSGGTYR